MYKDIIDETVKAVCDSFEISRDEFFKKTRVSYISRARFAMYYIVRKKKRVPISFIEKYMIDNGLRSPHSSILYGIRSISKDKKLLNRIS